MDFRTFSLKMIHCAVNSGAKLLSGGEMYVKAIKRELIGQYAETFILDGKEIKLYGKSAKSLGNMWQVILVSEECIKELRKRVPYYEHIEPLSRIYTNICKLKKKGIKSLQDEMKYCKIVGLSREEKDYLDMMPTNYFTPDDEKLLNKWASTIGKINYVSAIDSIKDSSTGRYLNSKKSGTAYARIAHLFNHGVRFVWMADPKAREGKPQIEIIRDYLENTCYKYSYDSSMEKWI